MSNLAKGVASPDSPALADGWNSSCSSERSGRRPSARFVAVAAVVLLTGCPGAVIDGPATPRGGSDGGTTTPPPWDGGGAPPPDETCEESTLETQELFSAMCSRCHGEVGSGGLANIDDVASLVRTGRIIPGNPENSPIFRRVSTGSMPPSGATPRPTDAQVGSLEAWIRCGAPPFDVTPTPTPAEQLAVDDVLDMIADDLRRFDNRAERLSKRYIILAHRVNAGASSAELSQLRDSVDVLVNHLSQGTRVVSPQPIDTARTVLRIDIEDYGWDAATWDLIVENYPYFVQYDDRSIEFPFDSSAQEFIQEETAEQIPFIFADWFVSNASQPPLYYEVLDLPGTAQELFAQLGVNYAQDEAEGDFTRAGFAVSGVSVSNRIIQRNRQPGGGYVWSSFDFLSSAGAGNIFQNPVDFEEDGGEIIFSLPNQLQGYYISNAAGVRQNAAPQAVVSDPRTPDRSVIAGLSCMGCHDSAGLIPRDDEIRAHVIATSPAGAQRDLVLATHPPNDQLMEIFDADSDAYRAARARIGLDGRSQPVPDTAIAYLEVDRGLRDLAALVWLDPDRVRDAIITDINLSNAFRALVTTSSGRVAREELEDQFDDIVCSIGVGRPVCTEVTESSPCGCVNP
ncbi:putative WD-40 repeat regulatory protein [Sandaracinus amylolyticus]|uniref:Putative WD-40 repeat regulatory protein n=1 Tax=Sandaracinus amylolyticus TaxID=927083 RepID=A0A0F6YN62_9BACT|nr:putative WD-40 repeat regulatory protein [Sandaracinus amylolyticus]